MPLKYLLTTFSLTMFGDSASLYIKTISEDEAKGMVGPNTQIVATRPSHENMAKNLFGSLRTTRFADMAPDSSALAIHYRGPPIGDDGVVPEGSTITYYLIESEEYAEEE
jgi:hypothetical protein